MLEQILKRCEIEEVHFPAGRLLGASVLMIASLDWKPRPDTRDGFEPKRSGSLEESLLDWVGVEARESVKYLVDSCSLSRHSEHVVLRPKKKFDEFRYIGTPPNELVAGMRFLREFTTVPDHRHG